MAFDVRHPARAGAPFLVAALWSVLACHPGLAGSATAAPGALDRVQLHGNANRGVVYLPEARASAPDGRYRLAARPIATIALDGDPLQNVYASLKPIDVDGDGRFEFVHFNGTRFMQVWSASGRRLWRVEDPTGYLHDMRAGTHRDTAAILDLDGDGRQDIAHCWNVGGRKSLVFRDGADGRVIRSAVLGDGNLECEIAAFRVAGRRTPLVLAGTTSKGSCPHDWAGYWARTKAYDLRQRLAWVRDTCEAGHYAWPVDQDRDGRAEAIFVGKYLLRPNGKRRCTLAGWPADDHVDSMAIADFLPARRGLEAVAVGASGTALFDAAGCRPIWRIPAAVIRNPQHVVAARLDTTSPAPLIVVEERGSEPGARTFVLTGDGRIAAVIADRFMPMQNANLDGALGVDELVGSFGQVVGSAGWRRLTSTWFWDLHGAKVRETSGGPYPLTYDRWQAFPLVFDYDHDGRDEIVQWGQSLIVVGKVAN